MLQPRGDGTTDLSYRRRVLGDPKDPHRDLACVLHDVSNALTVLLGWVGEAKRPDASPEAVAYALAIVEQRARIARDLARAAIGAPRIDEQRSIGEIVGEVLVALRVEAARAGTGLVSNAWQHGTKQRRGIFLSQLGRVRDGDCQCGH